MRPHAVHTAHPELIFYVLLGGTLAVGLYYFFKGFRVYWKFRLLENVPLIAIRGVAMGFVRVRGRASGEEVLTSPVSNQPCYYYKLLVEKFTKDKDNREWWVVWRNDSDAVPFYLEDETGKVLIYPRGAELDLSRSARVLVAGELPDKLGGRIEPASVEEARDPELNLYRAMATLGAGGPEVGRYRLTEHAIFSGADYDLAGTCFPNPLSKGDGDRKMIKKGKTDETFVISDRSSAGVTQRLDLVATLHIYGGALLAVVSAALITLVAWRT